MCLNSYDHYFAAYGGRRARADMVQGRVGSIFDPAPEIHGPMNGSAEALDGWAVEGLQPYIHPEDQESEITLKSLQPPELVPPTGSTRSESSNVAPQRFEIAVE